MLGIHHRADPPPLRPFLSPAAHWAGLKPETKQQNFLVALATGAGTSPLAIMKMPLTDGGTGRNRQTGRTVRITFNLQLGTASSPAPLGIPKDRLVPAEYYGSTDDELDFILNYDIKCHTGGRGSG